MDPLDLIKRGTQGVMRFAGSIPGYKAYKSLPPVVRTFINPVTSAVPTGGSLRSFAKGATAGILGDLVISNLAKQVLNKDQQDAIDSWLIGTSMIPGGPITKTLGYEILRPRGFGGAAEDEKIGAMTRDFAAKVAAQQQKRTTSASTPGAPTAQTYTPAPPALNPVPTQAPTQAPTQGGAVAIEVQPYTASAAPTVQGRVQARPTWVDSASAPEGVPLAAFYEAQNKRAAEIGAEELLRRMKAVAPSNTMSDANYMSWAGANPGLAYREVLKREARR